MSKLMVPLTKTIINVEIVINQQGKPTKKDHDMTYFQLLLDMMARDEFLYAWITSEPFFQHLEIVFEMHVPSQTDWDTYLSPAFHEYLPGSQANAAQYLKHYQRA